MIDVARIREDFPILHTRMRGKPLVYLDNAATTQKPRQVIEALVDYYENYNANIHRSAYAIAERATEAYEATRAKVASFINAPRSESIVFTRNTTEAINLVANAWGRKFLRPGDEIVITEMEHHSNIVPWQMVARATGATLRHVGVLEDGTLDMEEAASIIGPHTALVAAVHVSNVVGTINPVERLIALAHENGALALIDAAQSVPHMPVDVLAMGCDFMAFSSHKMLGPTGVGVLYGKTELLAAMDPFLGGGEMISQVMMDNSTWNELPWKFEAGTPNVADVIAFKAAMEYLEEIGMENVREHEVALSRHALDRLANFPDLKVYGPLDAEERGGVVAFNLGTVHPHDVGQVLDYQGIAIRSGHHCAQPLARRLDVVATARASYYVYNTPEEIDFFCEALNEALKVFAPAASR